MAARSAIDRAEPARHHLIYIPDPTVGARGIYHHIVSALGGRPSFHNAALVPQARDALAAEHAERGRIPILCIDEGHLLTHDALEALRLLTNHRLDTESPFATILLGQPTLAAKMALGILAALEQRITVRRTMTRHDQRGNRRIHPPPPATRGPIRPAVHRRRHRADPRLQSRQTPRYQPARPLRAHRRLRRRQEPRRRCQRPIRGHRNQPRTPARHDTLTIPTTPRTPQPRPKPFELG